MSKTLVTINDGKTERLVILPDTETNDVLQQLVNSPVQTENQVVKNFLKNLGASISIETPDSSNVERIVFNPVTSEVSFVFDNGSDSTYPSTFEKFLEDIQAPSAGKQQWKYRRGER